jgi:hypothetical protein
MSSPDGQGRVYDARVVSGEEGQLEPSAPAFEAGVPVLPRLGTMHRSALVRRALIGPLTGGQAILDALVDVGLVHPPAQARLADPQIPAILAIGCSRRRASSTARRGNSGGLPAGINGLLPETIIASDPVSG